MIGKTISHYKILEKLGEGGMGIVYKAEDTKLDRTIALKFLPPHISINKQEKKRFIHEAKAAAALDHPNICNIFEIDETDDGQMFIAMACYEGETLKDKIERGPLKINEALEIVIQVAEGLNKAHKKEIIHRDIKSANILITDDGVVKILDFGLAKLRGQTKLTKEGTTLGTVAYMSPEQITGEEVDNRSDIWSLGVLLYEMITGQLPFKGEYEQAVIYSIMNEEPEPVTGLRTGVPLELERILNKTLTKDSQERYQTTADLLVDLRNIKKESKPEVKSAKKELRQKVSKKSSRKFVIIGTLILAIIIVVCAFLLIKEIPKKELSKTEEIKQIRKIAVLPFVNMSADKDQEYFCDGISEELINRLAKISAFRVTARTSAFSFKGQNIDIPTIGKKLMVDIILEGSVRKAGDKLRITAQLVKVSDGYHIWSETYDRGMKDVFAIQDEISMSIVEKLKVSLLKVESTELKIRPTSNVEAYNLYLRGIDYLNRGRAGKSLRMAAQMFEKAITLDPNFALAFAKLSSAYVYLYWGWFDRSDTCLAKARDAVNTAFKISPNLPETQVALGIYHYNRYKDYDRALEHFKRAQKNLKNNSELFSWLATAQRRQGKWEEALLNYQKSLELNPLSNTVLLSLANTYLALRRYQEAETYYNQGISLAPDYYWGYRWKILLYIKQGNTKKALKVIEDAPENIRLLYDADIITILAHLYVYDGNYKKALKQLTLLTVDNYFQRNSFYPDDMKELLRAWIYGFLKQADLEEKYYDSARKILEKYVKENPGEYVSHSSLGIAYAGLGRKEEAILEGKWAVELLPLTKDAMWGGGAIRYLARIFVMVGEYDLAINQLELLLSIPSSISIPLLRIDPTWDPLRNHPRFQKLLKGKE
jgi:serine/threonine protein kinase/tetratricopeptide (TPR) repeat protein